MFRGYRNRGGETDRPDGVWAVEVKARLGRVDNLTVALVGSHPQQLVEALRGLASPLDATARNEILRLVWRDHHYHSKRR